MKKSVTKVAWYIFLIANVIGFIFGWYSWLSDGRVFGVEQLIEVTWHILAIIALFTFVTGIMLFNSLFWKIFFPVEISYFIILTIIIYTTTSREEILSTPNEVWFIMLPMWIIFIIPLLFSHYSIAYKNSTLRD